MSSEREAIRLRRWTSREPTREHDFYILSHGDHAGRPMEKSCPNCFIVNCKNQEERNNLYGLCLALWHAGSFRYYIHGSVIPFIRIGYAEGLLSSAYHKFLAAPHQQQLHIETIRKLDNLERLRHKEIDMIKQLKVTLARKHFHDPINLEEVTQHNRHRARKR